MKPNLSLGLSGHFKFVATKPDGTQRVLADWFSNLILDSGLNRLGSGGAWDRCQVGSGSTAPAVGQTALTTLVATTTTVQSTVAGTNTPTNTYAYARRTYRFAAGTATGNLSEVGIGWAAAGGGLFSRALITDGGGAPTTITVLADEVLDVIYEIRAYPTLTDQTFNLTIASVAYTFTVRPVRFSGDQSSGNKEWPVQLVALMTSGATDPAASGSPGSMHATASGSTLAAITASAPTGTNLVSPSTSGNSAAFTAAYVNNSYQRTIRNTFGLTAGSASFGGFVILSNLGDWQATVSPVIPKDATKILTLDYTIGWARKSI